MEIDPKKLDELLNKIERMSHKQDEMKSEIQKLKSEITQMKVSEPVKLDNLKDDNINVFSIPQNEEPEVLVKEETGQAFSLPETKSEVEKKKNTEEFVGGNLINKIGIIITIIGVFIGTKYAIDNNFISPLTRIILAYTFGLGLLFTAIRLKGKYNNFSAVLLSGSMAINYFVTFIAYSFYDMFPQAAAFIIMVMFTVFTVVAALHYNQQVIAFIGLAGAYAVPFLLSDNSGKIVILFSYLVIINAGILAISIKKVWKPLLFFSFILTWLIYSLWFSFSYNFHTYGNTAFIFNFLFFGIFYAAFITNKIIIKEIFRTSDIFLVLANSFIFYGIGYNIISDGYFGEDYLGLFTLLNAVIHLIISMIIYKNRLADRSVFYLITGLVLIFLTITIPVQLDGNWVTLFWIFESVVLFWIGRKRQITFYEKMAVPLIVISSISLLMDWGNGYFQYNSFNKEGYIIPVFNLNFLVTVLFIAASAVNYYISKINIGQLTGKINITKIIRTSSIILFLAAILFGGMLEIQNHFHQQTIDSIISFSKPDSFSKSVFNNDIQLFGNVWSINYLLVFLACLTIFCKLKLNNITASYINFGLNIFGMIIFLTFGLLFLSQLRDSYISDGTEYFKAGIFNIIIRYISLLIAAFLILISYFTFKKTLPYNIISVLTDLLSAAAVVWIASSELLNWMHFAGSQNSYKLGLSILWGICSLMLIIIGIFKNKKHLRIGALVLFFATLIKLFFYDIAHLSTISKTIVFVSLGILLLLTSFFYNKYKSVIINE